jgi:hypothetical protein
VRACDTQNIYSIVVWPMEQAFIAVVECQTVVSTLNICSVENVKYPFGGHIFIHVQPFDERAVNDVKP